MNNLFKIIGNIKVAIETSLHGNKSCRTAIRILDGTGETLCRVQESNGIVEFPLDPERPDVNGPIHGKRSPIEVVVATEKFIKLHRLDDNQYFREFYTHEEPDMSTFPYWRLG